MKKLIVWTLAFILIFTEVLFPIQMHAEETTDQCENMAFKVEAPAAGDEALNGKGHPGQEIELKFNDFEDVIEVDDAGSFEYEWKDKAPEADEIITLKNGPYEAEMIVTEEAVETEPVEAELVGTCEADVIPEEDEEEQSVEEEPEVTEEEFTGTDEITEEPPADEAAVDEESETEEQDDLEETQPELNEEAIYTDISEESEASLEIEEESIEEAEVEETTDEPLEEEPETEEVSDESEEDLQSEADDEIDQTDEAEQEELIEEEPGEVEVGEESTQEEIDEKEIEDDTKISEEDIDDTNAIEDDKHEFTTFSAFRTNRTAVSRSEVPGSQLSGNTASVSTPAEFNDALKSKNVQRIILKANIRQPNPSEVQTAATSGQKVIDTDGYDIDLVNGTMVLGESIRNMTIRGTNDSGRSTNLYTASNGEDDGFIEKERTGVKLHLENINFNLNGNLKAGKFGSNWEGEVHFHGHNKMTTGNSNNAFTFRKIRIHDNSTLELSHRGPGAAFVFNQDKTSSGEYGIHVGDYASLKVHSNSAVIKTSDLGNSKLNFNVGHRANADLKGTGTVTFDMDTEMIFNIDNPERVDLNNTKSGGRLFPDNLVFLNLFNRSNDVNFNIKNTELSGWTPGNTSNSPSSTSNSIQEGKFTFTTHRPLLIHRETTRVSVLKPGDKNFGDKFKPDMRRMIFAGSSPDEWGFVSAPENIAFETTEIKDEEQVIQRQSPHYDFEIIDTRKNSNWHLSAQAIEPLNNGNGNELEGAIHYFEADGSETLMEEEPVRIASKNTDGVQQVSWDSNEGILLKMNTIRAEADKEYSATINWTLTDGP